MTHGLQQPKNLTDPLHITHTHGMTKDSAQEWTLTLLKQSKITQVAKTPLDRRILKMSAILLK